MTPETSTTPARPALGFNQLSSLSLKIAGFMHDAGGIVRMDTVRKVAANLQLDRDLPHALQQLEEFELAQVCAWCDCLISIYGCDGRWCEKHQGTGYRAWHLPDCPRAAKKPAAGVQVLAATRRQA